MFCVLKKKLSKRIIINNVQGIYFSREKNNEQNTTPSEQLQKSIEKSQANNISKIQQKDRRLKTGPNFDRKIVGKKKVQNSLGNSQVKNRSKIQQDNRRQKNNRSKIQQENRRPKTDPKLNRTIEGEKQSQIDAQILTYK